MSDIEDDICLAPLAARLRVERRSRRWSIADLASRSSVSRAMISKIERAESSPTATVLGRLSAALGLTVSQLLARADAAQGQVSRANEQAVWRDRETGFTRRSLSPDAGAPTPLELVGAELESAKAVDYPAAAFAFIDDQQILVLEGQLRVSQGRTVHDLAPGDCLRLGPPAACVFENPGPERCRYLVAVLRAK